MLSKLCSTKKAYCYHFFPTKEEEESGAPTHGRTMVEIRDVYSPPVADPDHPWKIKLTLGQYELNSKKLVLSWLDMFDHVLRYWPLHRAKAVDLGLRMAVRLRDVTEDDNPRTYDVAYLQKSEGVDEFYLTCMELMTNRRMQVNDDVLLYWDSNQSCFVFKTISCEVFSNETAKDLDNLKLGVE